MGMIKNDGYVAIQSFMVTKLGLTGNNLIIYAIIYGFSQDGINDYHGTRAYLAEWCGCTVRGIQKNLNELVKRGLIAKVKDENGQQVKYMALWNMENASKFTSEQSSPVNKVPSTSEQSSPVPVNKVPSTSEQSSPRYYKDNIEDKLEDNIVCVVDTNKHTRFQQPTIEEVKEFSERNGKAVTDPVRFFEYYTANGWKVGKNKMKDWRAAFRMWESKDKGTGAGAGSRTKPEELPIMENEYTPEHLAKREADSMALLDKLAEGDG